MSCSGHACERSCNVHRHHSHIHTSDRAEDTVSRMTRELQFASVPNQVNDSVGQFAIFPPRPLAVEVENFRIELYGSFEIARLGSLEQSS